MFNFNSINSAEVNKTSRLPDNNGSTNLIDEPAVLIIHEGEDINELTWSSPYFTDFFKIYWSKREFYEITDNDVYEIHLSDLGEFVPGASPDVNITYDHIIPPAHKFNILYYRVLAFNRNGSILSNIVNNNNYLLSIYKDIYDKTLDDVTLRFTPELRKQYQDSILWRSFVQSICSELAKSRFEVKEAVKQLNIQKAISIFLDMWTNIIGISRINSIDSLGNRSLETDEQYRQRLIDNIFWDKISNLALKKTMLLRLKLDADVVDAGINPIDFRDVPTDASRKYRVTHGPHFIPGELILWNRVAGPDSYSRCVSDDGLILTYSDYSEDGTINNKVNNYYGFTSNMFALPDGEPSTPSIGGSGSLSHMALTNPSPSVFKEGDILSFAPSGASAICSSDQGGVLTFELSVGSNMPFQYDVVRSGSTRSVLISSPIKLIATMTNVNSKLLSNIYSINLGISLMKDEDLNVIYDEVSSLEALGNVLTKILQDSSFSFDDWDTSYGNILYGEIFFGNTSYNNTIISTETNWNIGDEIYMDNQWAMDETHKFYANSGPDDIAILTRTS